ncbi:MAG: hypothetical protein KDJ52_06165 [Anaerolineae bacterium]|nr:hypothetical protein [Anaerolineae bacterium]
MGAIIFILLGSLFALAGLVGLAPQVRVHQIDPQSTMAWLFRAGAFAILSGQVLGLVNPLDTAFVTVSLLMGWAILFVSLAVASHERQQPGFMVSKSLSLQIFILGAIITGMAFLLR